MSFKKKLGLVLAEKLKNQTEIPFDRRKEPNCNKFEKLGPLLHEKYNRVLKCKYTKSGGLYDKLHVK